MTYRGMGQLILLGTSGEMPAFDCRFNDSGCLQPLVDITALQHLPSRLRLYRRSKNTEQTEITEPHGNGLSVRFFPFIPLFPFVSYSLLSDPYLD
jgi:hypothetical protein